MSSQGKVWWINLYLLGSHMFWEHKGFLFVDTAMKRLDGCFLDTVYVGFLPVILIFFFACHLVFDSILCWIRLLQLFELASNHGKSADEGSIALLHSQLKNASVYSGIHGRPSVLLVHEGLGDECLADVCAFLKDGNRFSSLTLLLLQHKPFELVKFLAQFWCNVQCACLLLVITWLSWNGFCSFQQAVLLF